MEETVAFETMKYLMFELGLRKQYRPDMMALQVRHFSASGGNTVSANHRPVVPWVQIQLRSSER